MIIFIPFFTLLGKAPAGLLQVLGGFEEDTFGHQKATFCVDKLTINRRVTMVICVQPVHGQFITIQHIMESHHFHQKSFYSQGITDALELCNVRIYGMRKYIRIVNEADI